MCQNGSKGTDTHQRLAETQVSTIEGAFQEFTERKDIAILLINQHARPLSIFIVTYLTYATDCREDQTNSR